jgi:Protein of unknown function (DUF3140)/Hypervirulence associated proteins TUDOR domain
MAKAVKKALKKGDKVEWNTPQGKTGGIVKKKLTSTTKVKGHTAKATKKEPEYLVESNKTGRKAAHKAEALKKPKAAKKTVEARSKPAAKKKAAAKTSVKRTAPASSVKKTVKTAAAKKPVAKKSAVNAKPVKNGKAPKMNVDQVIKEFRTVVNLKPDQLERWLSLPDSRKLGFKDEVKEGTVGHESGRRILKILSKRRDKYTDDDLRHMQTVVGFVQRHRKEKPPGDVFASNWRYSLMNWGHDPMK